VARWHIDHGREIRPPHGSSAYAAFEIVLAGADPTQTERVVVEYAIGATRRLASPAHVREVVEPYLDEAMPPRRLLVDPQGNVSVRGSED
jgi:hypothetical protein